MAYDEKLATRVRNILKRRRGIAEQKMFGGICFMLNGNMCCGVEKDRLMLRVGPKQYENVLGKKHARLMDFTGRPMKGMVFIDPEGLKTSSALKKWIDFAVQFAQSLPVK